MAAELLRRATLPDELEIVIGDVSVGRAGLVTANRLPRLVRLGLWAGNVTAVGMALWLFFGDGPTFAVVAATLLTTWGHTAWERRKKAVLTDPVLANAAVRAARALGRELRPGRWRISSPEAKELGRELVRLHGMRIAPGPGDYDQRREQALLDAAAPVLRAFMQSTLAAGRPLAALEGADVEPPGQGVPHEPGAPWPVLDQPESQWPVLPPDAERT